MIELYHCRDARSFRALWALEELGLPYRLHVLPFPPRAHRPDYLALNPLGTIPLLIDGDVRMIESAAIPQYLATLYGPTPLAVGVEEPGLCILAGLAPPQRGDLDVPADDRAVLHAA